MTVNRIVQVRHANPLRSFQEFLAAWWPAIGLQSLLAPIESADRSSVITGPIEQLTDLDRVNPFAPIMVSNAAALVNSFVRDHAGQRLAVMLRPCELRALIELRKRRRAPAVDEAIKDHSLMVIGLECAATYPVDEYARRMVEHQAALMFAGEGSYSPYDLRPACKVCDWPTPRGADVIIGTLGVAVEQYLLIITRDDETDERWRLGAVTTGLATECQVAQHETAVGNLIDERAAARAQQLGPASGYGPTSGSIMDFARLLSWVSNCTLCGDCLDACPLYNGELASLLGVGGAHRNTCGAPLANFIEIARWLTSCSGCGMCEAACEQDVPLGLIASALSHGIRGGLHHYAAGDPDQPLPWAGR